MLIGQMPMCSTGNSSPRTFLSESGCPGHHGQEGAARSSGRYAGSYLRGPGGRCGLRRRTPGPPPFPSMNSTPAASKARRMAKSFGAVIEVSASASSARRIVATPTADSRARSAARHRRKARAARICPLVNGFRRMLTAAILHDIPNIIEYPDDHGISDSADLSFDLGGSS
jgi:hypothetical protein